MYSLLFGAPGLFIAGMLASLALAGFAGLLWLYVFGDDAWPSWAQTLLSVLFVVVFLSLWLGSILLGFIVGRSLERRSGWNRSHILLSAALTVVFLVSMVVYQWRVGNLGPQADSAVCSEFCSQHGYSGSGMPPEISGDRTCSCYDESGAEILRIPLDHLRP